jgi:hypothetical protein
VRRPEDDTLTKSEIELAKSQASADSDQGILAYADRVMAALREERRENHWSRRVKEAWQEGK